MVYYYKLLKLCKIKLLFACFFGYLRCINIYLTEFNQLNSWYLNVYLVINKTVKLPLF